MTAFALGIANYRNAVSKRYGEVSRQMWRTLWPESAGTEICIDHITNGVHVPTWIEPKMRLLFDKHLGSGWLEDHDSPVIWELIEKIPSGELWRTHYWLKVKLIDAIREQSRRRWVTEGASPSIV
jgi:starch phosphorylase